MSKRKPADEVERSFSIAELCEAENISAGTKFQPSPGGSWSKGNPFPQHGAHHAGRAPRVAREIRAGIPRQGLQGSEQQRRIAVAKLGNAASLRTRRSALQT